jgi:hypothetical protein
MSNIELVSKIVKPKAGENFAFHVFTPALQYRASNPKCNMPVMALRSSLTNFEEMVLYHQIDVLGPSSLKPLFDQPLPGTGGRGVAIMFTASPMEVWYPKGRASRKIKTFDGREPQIILADVIKKYVERELVSV